MPRNSQAASAKRRVAVIHSASTLRAASAPISNAKGTVNSVYPEYSIGGGIIIDGWRSSGSRPAPCPGALELATHRAGARARQERRGGEHEQAGEERAEPREHRGRHGRDVAHPVPREEQHEARP